jgi:hypothetical protein
LHHSQLAFYEQARCLFYKKSTLCGTGILPVAEMLQDACSTRNPLFVEQASCLLLKMVQDVRLN